MREVLALEPHARSPALRQAGGEGERGGTTHPAGELRGEFRLKVARVQMLAYPLLDALERGNEGLRNVAPAERTEAPTRVR